MSTLTLTAEAGRRLGERLATSPEAQFIRLAAMPTCGCGAIGYRMAIEATAHDDDEIVDVGGVQFLVDPGSVPYLDGGTIDYRDEMVGGGFMIDNPAAPAGCGCGHH